MDFDRREGLAAETDRRSPLCESDLLAGERAVPALVLDYRDLEQMIPKPISEWTDGQPGAGKREAPVPLSVAVVALQEEICWVMTTWGDVVRERGRVSGLALYRAAHPSAPGPSAAAGMAVQRAAVILGPRVRMLAVVGDVEMASYPNLDDDTLHRVGVLEHALVPGWRGVLDMIGLHRRARAALGITELTHDLPGECPNCDERTLRRDNGSDTVYCVHCDHRRPYGDYERYLKMLVWDGAA